MPVRARTAWLRYLTVRRYPHRSAPRSRRSRALGGCVIPVVCVDSRLVGRHDLTSG